jgi:TPR repeat protein
VGINAWADLTREQANTLPKRIILSGDMTALEILTTEAVKGNQYAQTALGSFHELLEDHGEAMQWFRKAAEQGDADAQSLLGTYYEGGDFVPQDYGQAAQWYRKAAIQGNANGQYNFGDLYAQGHGVPQDMGQAVRWFRKAATQGHVGAQGRLASAYFTGVGVPQDYSQAIQWWSKAAQRGDASSQYFLGYLYALGKGVPQSKVVAYALFNLSAAQAPTHENDAFKHRSSLEKNMTKQEIEVGQALSQKMSISGNLLKALDGYLATSGSERR